jgi:hypothetical protein
MSRLNRFGRLLPTVLRAALLLVKLTSAVFAQSDFAQSDLAQRMAFLRSSSLSLEVRWQKLSVAEKASAYLKRITPFYSWLNLCTAVDVEDKPFLMGGCLQEEADAIFSMPMGQFQRRYSNVIEGLWARNELDAISFASAAVGEATSVRQLRDMMSAGQLVGIAIIVFVLIRKAAFTTMLNIRWELLKRAFYACSAIWLLGGALLQVAAIEAGPSTALLNLQTIVLLIFGSLSLLLGAFLFGRWLYSRSS